VTQADEPVLHETSKTEVTVRQFDPDGRVTSETTTVTVVRREGPPDALPTGMYL
jgi:hypothetical protein